MKILILSLLIIFSLISFTHAGGGIFFTVQSSNAIFATRDWSGGSPNIVSEFITTEEGGTGDDEILSVHVNKEDEKHSRYVFTWVSSGTYQIGQKGINTNFFETTTTDEFSLNAACQSKNGIYAPTVSSTTVTYLNKLDAEAVTTVEIRGCYQLDVATWGNGVVVDELDCYSTRLPERFRTADDKLQTTNLDAVFHLLQQGKTAAETGTGAGSIIAFSPIDTSNPADCANGNLPPFATTDSELEAIWAIFYDVNTEYMYYLRTSDIGGYTLAKLKFVFELGDPQGQDVFEPDPEPPKFGELSTEIKIDDEIELPDIDVATVPRYSLYIEQEINTYWIAAGKEVWYGTLDKLPENGEKATPIAKMAYEPEDAITSIVYVRGYGDFPFQTVAIIASCIALCGCSYWVWIWLSAEEKALQRADGTNPANDGTFVLRDEDYGDAAKVDDFGAQDVGVALFQTEGGNDMDDDFKTIGNVALRGNANEDKYPSKKSRKGSSGSKGHHRSRKGSTGSKASSGSGTSGGRSRSKSKQKKKSRKGSTGSRGSHGRY